MGDVAADFPTNVTNAFDHSDTPATTGMFPLGFPELDVGDADNFTLTFIP